jgi:hypothetical protein
MDGYFDHWARVATEIIHISQAVLFYGGSFEYFRDTVLK